MPGTAHDLATIKSLASGAAPLIYGGTALYPVMDRLDMTQTEARAFILALVANLTDADYVETVTNKAPPADVYGVEAHRIGWYVKVALEANGSLTVCSCHPPTKPMRTRGGITIR
jgi:hypothetical protein